MTASAGPPQGAPPPETHQARVEARLRRRRRYRLVRSLVRGTLATLALIVVVLVAGLSQTREGQGFVLDKTIERIRGALAGELTVGGIRGRTLLTGATLLDVRLDAADGREFLRADSVVVRYSLASLLSGGGPIRSTVIWGADIEISQYSPDEVLNVTRIVAGDGSDSARTTAERTIPLGRIGIRDGRVRVLTPAPEHTDRTATSPDGAPLRRILFEGLDLDLEDALLRPGGAVSFETRLVSFSSSVQLVEEPLVLREVFGDVTFGAQGIRIDGAAFRLPSTLLRGSLAMGPEHPGGRWILRSQLETDGWGDLADIAWIDPRIPAGRFRGSATLRVPGAVEADLSELEVQLEESNLVADGWVRFDGTLPMRGMRIRASPLATARLEPWLGVDFPLDGWLSGQATFSGTLADLGATGRLTLVPTGFGGAPTTADFNGTIHRGANPGATDFELRLDPFNYTVLESYWPGAPWAGTGTARFELNGRAEAGMTVLADLTHEAAQGETSRVVAHGVTRRLDDGEWISDLRGELAPLSVSALARLAPGLDLEGSLSGPITAAGTLGDMQVGGDLTAQDGALSFTGRVDMRDPASLYRITAEAADLHLSEFSAELPTDARWSGRLDLTGSGFELRALEATATLTAHDSRVGPVPIDTAAAAFRIEGGVLVTDTLQARVAGVELEGRGRFGLAEGTWGSSRVAFRAESLIGLRPLVMGVGDSVMVGDTLNDLDREFLRATGIEPDTLPTLLDVRMAGSVRGAASLSGEIRSFDLGLLVDLVDGEYRRNQVDTARVAFTATELPATSGSWGIGASARGIVWQGRTFEQGGFEAEMVRRAGDGRVELVRSADEAYRAAGSFRFDSLGGEVGLTEAQIEVAGEVWNLTRPSRIAWGGESLVVDSLDVHREGPDPMSLHVDGVLTRGGESDFRMVVDGLHLDRLVHVAQLEGVEASGHLDLDLAVAGPAETPRISGTFRVDGPRYGALELTRLDGALDYANRLVDFRLTGWDGLRDAIDAEGTVPLDLSLALVADRVPDRPMEVDIRADSLDAAIALSYLTSLEQVVGIVSGEIHVGGTLDAPRPEGLVTLDGGEWTIEAIGVRHSGVNGRLTLNPDRTVDVALAATGDGSSTVNGTVTLIPFRNPALDLTFAFRQFPAVARADVEALISGEFVLSGTYERPVAEGAITVNEATIYVDEFRRAASVVDLNDPLLFQDALQVDTTALIAQPLIAGLRNPFFDNLRVDIDLAVPRDTWLRSVETNVEMTGDLLVVYDRREGDFVLIGELQAVRGSHLVLGRTFQLDGGTVRFIGRPGLNPDLDIEASTRIFRRQDDDLEVSAHVGGTLVQPVVTLSTEEAGTSEADILSYLVFGQAAGQLGGNQAAAFGQLADAAAATAAVGALTFGSGAFFNQFGAALAQETGVLDYVSIQMLGTGGGPASQLAGRSQVEAGKYLGRNLFAVVVLRPSTGDVDARTFAGARIEWEIADVLGGEVFAEDRFLRTSASAFVLPELIEDNLVYGIFIFRDWGY